MVSGWLWIEPEALIEDDDLVAWLDYALAFNVALNE